MPIRGYLPIGAHFACCRVRLLLTHWLFAAALRCCTKANTDAFGSLQGQAAAIQQASDLATAYLLNPSTAQIWQHLINKVHETGSLAGMLRAFTVPLVHLGYQLPPFQKGVDLEWLGLTPETAQALLEELLAVISTCNLQLYGADAIPAAPDVKLLFQSLVDLLACSYDRMKATAKPAPAAADLGQQEQEQQPAEQQAPAEEPAAAGGVPIEGSTLPRGTGLLFLLQSSWSGKGKPLPSGRALVSGQVYTHYTVGCLMTKQGLLFKRGQPQQVSVRVAHEFLSDGIAAAGLWSSSAFPVTVEPYATLLLMAQPAVLVKKRFNADAPGYMALYGSDLSDSEESPRRRASTLL